VHLLRDGYSSDWTRLSKLVDIDEDELGSWQSVAGGLVDQFDAKTQLYEEFSGFFELKDLPVADAAPRPFSGEEVFGWKQLRGAQVVKQADVVMMLHMLRGHFSQEVAAANYRYYEPRTTHGSSLSPAIHSAVAARADLLDDAVTYFRMGANTDLGSKAGFSAKGVHMATAGGLWQAAVMGFGGLVHGPDHLTLDPRLPAGWSRLKFPIRSRGAKVLVDIETERVTLTLDGPATVALGPGAAAPLAAGQYAATRNDGGWSALEKVGQLMQKGESTEGELARDAASKAGASPKDEAHKLDAVIFDLDGVVTNTAAVHARAWKRLFDDYLRKRADQAGEAFKPFEIGSDYPRYVDGKRREDGVRSFLASRDIELPDGEPDDPPTAETVRGLGKLKDGYFLKDLEANGVETYPSTVALIERLKANDVLVALVSASRNVKSVLAGAGLSDLFEVKVDGLVADEMKLPGKPQPDTFLEAAKRLHVEASQAAIVEDALSGVEAGRSGNFGLVIGVNRTGQAEALQEHGADVVVDDLGDLPKEVLNRFLQQMPPKP
jgi:beta-phosphoglucomutase family hydrolase